MGFPCLFQGNCSSLPVCNQVVQIWFCMEKKQIPCKVRKNTDLCSASWCCSSVLLLFQDFEQDSGHVDTQQAWDSDSIAIWVFFHLQVSHWETQSSIPCRDTSNCCQVYRCCPSWLAILRKGVRTGFGWYEYTCQEYATSTLQNNTPSPAPPCALSCLKLSISYLIVALFGIFVKEQALGCWWFPRHAQDCLHQSALDKEVF